MTELLNAAFTLPTAIWTVLLIPVALYWLTFLFGVLDLDILDGLFESFEAVEGIDGALEGAVEGTVEGALEGAVDGAVEGAAEGAAEGVADAGEGRGCLAVLGLTGVPVAISGTILVVFAWLLSYGGMELVAAVPDLAAAGALAATGVGVAAAGLALGGTSVAIRPLRKLFRLAPVTRRLDLVGRACRVKTLRIDGRFGQAAVEDNGAAILIQARCRKANELSRGDRALIYEYDARAEVFWVVPLDPDLDEAYEIDT